MDGRSFEEDKEEGHDTNGRDTPTPPYSENPSPPESRASPSFSFHEERRLLKSDEYWLSHKLPRLPPASLSTSPSVGLNEGLANLSMSVSSAASGGMNYARTLELDAEDGDEAASGHRPIQQNRQSTMLIPSEDSGLDPTAILHHRLEHDKDERLALEEEDRERELEQMESMPGGGAAVDNILQSVDTGESPAPEIERLLF